MSNAFSKEVMVAFDQSIAGFEDALVISRNVTQKNLSAVDAARTNDVLWVPQPYILASYSGTDMTSNFGDVTQLSVPLSMGNQYSVPFKLSMKDSRDPAQEAKLVKSAIAKLASDINKSVSTVAAAQGSIVVKRGTAAGYDDIAAAESFMDEQGVPSGDRYFALNTRDYNSIAKDLATATRSLQAPKSLDAYEKSLVGRVAGFDTYKVEYTPRIAAAAGGASITLSNAAATTANHYIPLATTSYLSSQVNIDNRFHTVTVSSTTSVAAGDSFTIADVYAVNHITKDSTGQLKTFRVISVTDSTHMVITPPIIDNQATAASASAAQYQNCTCASLGSKAIVWLNTVSAPSNIFWHKDSIILMPGKYSLNATDGVPTISATTESGIEIVVSKQRNILTGDTYIRADSIWGAICANTEMCGIELFSQT